MTQATAVGQDAGVLARAQGCWLGQLAGDALGSMVEFKPAATIRQMYPGGLHEIGPSRVFGTLAGQPTDDSELALALARALVAHGFDVEPIAAAYGDWHESGPFDEGGATRQALSGIAAARRRGDSAAATARESASQSSQANGALMRQSPLGIWGYALDPMVLDGYVRADTQLTHPNPVCQDASAAFIVALAAVIHEGLDGPAAYARACAWDQAHGHSPKVTQALAAAQMERPNYEQSIGHVPIALQNAFYQALYASSFADGVVDTVMQGGDTDTNAAIAGALLGAIHEADAVPYQWRAALLACRPAQGAPEVHRPRPEMYWPVDALDLAAQLLAAGRRA
jgi:ADP-ribosyl-[dinitrogen reductase] hydrolase